MKPILLSGGTGTRMWPTTMSVNKHLLPVFNKPMIYYSLNVLLMCKIIQIIIICDPINIKLYKKLLGTGSDLGIKLKYLIQKNPNGIPEAFLISKNYIKNNKVCLLLRDNFFYGHDLGKFLKKGMVSNKGAFFFSYHVKKPKNYALINNKGKTISTHRTKAYET
jgi:dTDP-glucose pyrophosphorylase